MGLPIELHDPGGLEANFMRQKKSRWLDGWWGPKWKGKNGKK